MGGSAGDFVGGITGGLIGESPQEKAEKEAKKRQKQLEEERRKADEKKQREDELLKQQEQDIADANMAGAPDTPKAKPETTVDFGQSIKATEDEDELLKMFRGAGK